MSQSPPASSGNGSLNMHAIYIANTVCGNMDSLHMYHISFSLLWFLCKYKRLCCVGDEQRGWLMWTLPHPSGPWQQMACWNCELGWVNKAAVCKAAGRFRDTSKGDRSTQQLSQGLWCLKHTRVRECSLRKRIQRCWWKVGPKWIQHEEERKHKRHSRSQ